MTIRVRVLTLRDGTLDSEAAVAAALLALFLAVELLVGALVGAAVGQLTRGRAA